MAKRNRTAYTKQQDNLRGRKRRDRIRGRSPRHYGTKPLVDNSFKLKIQALLNHAFYHNTSQWLEPTPNGNKIKIQIDAAYFQPIDSNYWHPPHWIAIGGVQFPLQRYLALHQIDRWLIVDGQRRFSKICVLKDGTVGTRHSLGLIYRTEQLTQKSKRLRTRHKLVNQIRGGQVLDVEYVKAHPDYIPERRRNMWRKRYWHLQQLLLHPDYRQQRKQAVEGLCERFHPK